MLSPIQTLADGSSRGEIAAQFPRLRPVVSIEGWFNPDDDGHLMAYEQFQATGAWPEGFLPENVVLPPSWSLSLTFVLAQKWLRHRADVRYRADGVE